MKYLLFLAALIVLCVATKWHELDTYTFEKYETEFKRSYITPTERFHRKSLFERRLAEIKAHNTNPGKTWKRGVNHLTDRTDEELKSLRGVRKELISKRSNVRTHTSINHDISRFEGVNVDWRDKNIITAVKDQGRCGSCWTFATAENVESYWALATGQLVDLSEQQILDCTPNPDKCGGTGGCEGGTAELALARIIVLGGLTTEWRYPYTSYYGQDSPQCHFDISNTPPFAKVASFVVLPSNEYAPTLEHISTKGPLIISVDASAWSDYESGVFDGCNQTNPDIDHAVQLVGVGTDPQLGDYWLVRNSWSPAWGEHGYVRIRRTSDLRCGIDLSPGDGDGCSNGPKEVKVCGTCGILFDNVYPVVVKQ